MWVRLVRVLRALAILVGLAFFVVAAIYLTVRIQSLPSILGRVAYSQNYRYRRGVGCLAVAGFCWLLAVVSTVLLRLRLRRHRDRTVR